MERDIYNIFFSVRTNFRLKKKNVYENKVLWLVKKYGEFYI